MTLALKGLNICGKRMTTMKYESIKPSTQCIKCQKIGHRHFNCKNQPKCQYCAGDHESQNHKCITCTSKSTCEHNVVKCSNCQGNHQANDKKCEHCAALNCHDMGSELKSLHGDMRLKIVLLSWCCCYCK